MSLLPLDISNIYYQTGDISYFNLDQISKSFLISYFTFLTTLNSVSFWYPSVSVGVKFLAKTLVFCLFSLNPATRPNSEISSKTLFVLDSGSCNVKTRSSAKAFSLYCFTPTSTPCTCRSSLIMFSNTSRTEINKRGDRGHPCRVPFSILNSSVTTLFTISLAFSCLVFMNYFIKYLFKSTCQNVCKYFVIHI
uniref:Uncharacterized protein n=1 Tax=Podarcis muralis TaxID=64176 RepID=A0A670IZM8_PODMU